MNKHAFSPAVLPLSVLMLTQITAHATGCKVVPVPFSKEGTIDFEMMNKANPDDVFHICDIRHEGWSKEAYTSRKSLVAIVAQDQGLNIVSRPELTKMISWVKTLEKITPVEMQTFLRNLVPSGDVHSVSKMVEITVLQADKLYERGMQVKMFIEGLDKESIKTIHVTLQDATMRELTIATVLIENPNNVIFTVQDLQAQLRTQGPESVRYDIVALVGKKSRTLQMAYDQSVVGFILPIVEDLQDTGFTWTPSGTIKMPAGNVYTPEGVVDLLASIVDGVEIFDFETEQTTA